MIPRSSRWAWVCIAALIVSGTVKAMYCHDTGRFLQRDPIGVDPSGGRTNSFNPSTQLSMNDNLFEYVKSRPIMNVDFTGLWPEQGPPPWVYDQTKELTDEWLDLGCAALDKILPGGEGGFLDCFEKCIEKNDKTKCIGKYVALPGLRKLKTYPVPGKPETKSIFECKRIRDILGIRIRTGMNIGRAFVVPTIGFGAYYLYLDIKCYSGCVDKYYGYDISDFPPWYFPTM